MLETEHQEEIISYEYTSREGHYTSSKDKRFIEISSRNMRKGSIELPNKLVIIKIIYRTKIKPREERKPLFNFRKVMNIYKTLNKNGCTSKGIGRLRLL